MSKPIFYDPERRRWKRLRLISDPLGLVLTAIIVFFVISLIRTENLTSLSLPDIHPAYKTLKERQRKPRRPGEQPVAHQHRRSAERCRGARDFAAESDDFSGQRQLSRLVAGPGRDPRIGAERIQSAGQ